MGRKNRFLNRLLVIIVAILLVVFAPLVLLIFSPIYLFRWILFKVAPILRPDLGKMMTTRSHLYGVDDLYVNPNSTLVIVARLQGILDIKTMRKVFLEKVIDSKDASGQILRPELKQYISTWFGFRFWKHETKFDIKEHIKVWEEEKSFMKSCSEIPGLEREINGNEVGEERLMEIQKELIGKPFVRQKSPWELWLIPNYKPKPTDPDIVPGGHMCAFALRIHHAMADGGSLTRLFLALSSQELDSIAKPHFVKRGFCEKILYGAGFMILAIYEFALQLIDMKDDNEIHNTKIVMTKKIHFAASRPVPIQVLKDIKSAAGVSFVSVIYGAIVGGLRNFFLKNEYSVPRAIHTGIPVPLPGHPEKLRNYMSFLCLKLPIGVACPLKRIKKIFNKTEGLKKSTLPIVNSFLITVLGGLFIPMVRKLAQNNQVSLITTIVPFSNQRGVLFGLPHVGCRFASGMLGGQTGIIVTVLSYVDQITFMVECDDAICSSDGEAEDLLNLMVAEIDELKEATRV